MFKRSEKPIILLIILFTFWSCNSQWTNPSNTSGSTDNDTEDVEEISGSDTEEENEDDHEDEDDYTWDESSEISIILNGTSITSDNTGVSIDGTTATITSVGNYTINGTLSDGQIIVDTEEEGTIRLILNGVDITSTTSAPIFISNADKVVIKLEENTENYLTDSDSYTYDSSDEDEPNATLFSKDDLTIFGTGSLTIDANYNDAITSKDGLIINSGIYNITTVDDGIRGKDYLVIEDGTISINSGGDGLKSDNDSDTELGYISIVSGTIAINAKGDGIDAETDVIINYGDFTITTEGTSSHYTTETTSTKGIKAGVSLVIEDGTFIVDSYDDAIHSNDNISINGGTFTLTTDDDGIHADTELGIYGGDITITKSYEGIESMIISINDGNISITSSDDGINAGGGNDGSSNFNNWGGSSSSSYCIYINGGYIYIDSDGDGVDSNGSIVMTAGEIIVDGPTSSADGAIDYDASFTISEGYISAAGSSGMAEGLSSSSSQYSVKVTLSSKSANTLFHVEDGDGNYILTIAPSKSYSSVVFSSSELQQGTTYYVYYGGSCNGTLKNSKYENGTYSGGTQYTSFTISSTTTTVGSNNSGGNGNNGGGPGGW